MRNIPNFGILFEFCAYFGNFASVFRNQSQATFVDFIGIQEDLGKKLA